MGKKRKSMALTFTDSITPPSDAFSSLPESIIYRIFSFLEPNQTVRLTLVSKKFKRLCLQTPYLYLSADFDSSKNFSTRYPQFCNYVENFMKMRERLGIGINRFLFHWFCKNPRFNVGMQLLNSCLKKATVLSNVRELDLLVYSNWWNASVYSFPVCVCEFKNLRVLKLNLQMGKFRLEDEDMDFVEVFLLDSVCISDVKFGRKISFYWTSLRRLNLHNVKFDDSIYMKNISVEELELSNCEIGSPYFDWTLDIDSSSLKSLSISKCHFKSRCRVILDCSSLKNFSVFGSDFDMFFTFQMASQSLDNLGICSSSFSKVCSLCLSCPFIKQISINGCKFKELCRLKMNCLSLDALTVSDCELIYPDEKSFVSGCQRRINVFAHRLETLTLYSSDKNSYKFPLCINAQSLQAITWKGNPVDFSYLKSLESLENAIIDIQPSCQHKSKKLACRCKLFMASIYTVAMLLQSLKDVKSLEINLWPIELFFMQNDEPIIFKNLVHLFLLVNDLSADQLSFIASFLKGLPNLITLVIKFEKKSALRSDPDLVCLLGLCPEAFSASLIEESKQLKITKGNAEEDLINQRW